MKRSSTNNILLPGLLAFALACNTKGPGTTHVISPSSPVTSNNFGLDKSPMDMSYYPHDYPILKMSGNVKEDLVARVIYSRPHKDGRKIFGEVVKYGIPWRLGANEATEIEFFRDVNISGKKIPKGRYILYAVPYENNWKLILNNDLFTWGLKIDRSKDLFVFEEPVRKNEFPVEVLTIEFEKAENGMNLIMAWDTVRVALPVTL
jgi:hypothetical protein